MIVGKKVSLCRQRTLEHLKEDWSLLGQSIQHKLDGVGVVILVLHTIQHKIRTFHCNSDDLLKIASLTSF